MNDFAKEVEDYFCKFTFGQFVALILLELVTLFFVFYLGARFGPDLIGGKRIAEVSEKTETPPEQPSVDYTFPQELSDGAPGGKGVIRVKPSGMTATEYENSLRVVVPAPAAEEKRVEKPAEVTPAAEAIGKYAIQVGSYPSAEEAARVVDQWKGKGYDTFMTVGEVPKKGTWYRVRIGHFKDKEEARLFSEQFKKKEKSDALVVLSQS